MESNHRLPPYKGGTLTAELQAQIFLQIFTMGVTPILFRAKSRILDSVETESGQARFMRPIVAKTAQKIKIAAWLYRCQKLDTMIE